MAPTAPILPSSIPHASQIDESRATKRDVLAEIVEVERQIMLWERKILLEKEMADVLDPTVGQVSPGISATWEDLARGVSLRLGFRGSLHVCGCSDSLFAHCMLD